MEKIKHSLLLSSLTLMFVSIMMLGFEFGFGVVAAEVFTAANLALRPAPVVKPAAALPTTHTNNRPIQAQTSTLEQPTAVAIQPIAQLSEQVSAANSKIVEAQSSHSSTLSAIGRINLAQPPITSATTMLAPDTAKSSAILQGGVLSIPKLKLETEIMHLPNYGAGWNLGLIDKNVALLGDTGRYPLDERAMVFSAHVIDSWEFGPFFHLDKLMPQDQVSYIYRNQKFIYEVSRLMYVTPDRADLLYQDNGEQIILMTCSDYSFSSGIFEKRLLVIADLVDVQPVSPNLGLSDENPIYEN